MLVLGGIIVPATYAIVYDKTLKAFIWILDFGSTPRKTRRIVNALKQK